MTRRPARSTLSPYTTLFRSHRIAARLPGENNRRRCPHLWITLWMVGLDPSVVHQISSNQGDRKSTRLNSSHMSISYAVFCLKKKTVTGKLATHNVHDRSLLL